MAAPTRLIAYVFLCLVNFRDKFAWFPHKLLCPQTSRHDTNAI